MYLNRKKNFIDYLARAQNFTASRTEVSYYLSLGARDNTTRRVSTLALALYDVLMLGRNIIIEIKSLPFHISQCVVCDVRN